MEDSAPSKPVRIGKKRDQCRQHQSLITRPPYARMVRIHQMLTDRALPNCSTLADEFEVSYKTVQRDIDFMRDQMGLPIEYDQVDHGFYYTKPVTSFPVVQVKQGELVALLVAQKAVEQYRGTVFERPLRSAFERMSANLQEEENFSLKDLGEAFSFRPTGPAAQEMEVFEVLAEAVVRRRVVEFSYHGIKNDAPVPRCIEPYHLGCIDNAWYLIGNDLQRGQLRTFALTRLTGPKMLKRVFRRPPDFSAAKMMEGSFSAFEAGVIHRVKIRLDAFAARLASERVWHASQKLKPLPARGAELTMEVGLAPDLEKWILGWGAHAEVLEPAVLRDRIASIARSMALQYPP